MTTHSLASSTWLLGMKKYIRVCVVAIILAGMLHLFYDIFIKSKSQPTVHVHSDNPTLERIDGILADGISSHSNKVDLRIIVITFNRPESVSRCLESINKAEYYGDRIHVDIWIDRSKRDGTIHNQTSTAAAQFQFQHGTVEVHRRKDHVGLYGQWLTTWEPPDDTREIAIIVEDDITLSKYFYKWLKLVHKKYDSVPHINGFSLQGKSIKHAGDKGKLHGPEEEVVFSYPVLGSWGFSPSPKNWLAFLKWYQTASKDKSFMPAVPGLVTTDWYKAFKAQGKSDGIWTQWHIYYTYIHKELTIYVNLPNHQGLAINWEEPGLHYFGNRKTTNKDPLLEVWDDKYGDLPDVPAQLDAHGQLVNPAQKKLP